MIHTKNKKSGLNSKNDLLNQIYFDLNQQVLNLSFVCFALQDWERGIMFIPNYSVKEISQIELIFKVL